MDKYFEEMYKYLSTPENYSAAKEISGLLPRIERQLIIDFWKAFQSMKFHDEDKAWTNRIEPWSGANGFTLFLSKPAWKDDIAVAFDTGLDNGNFTEFDYGIFLVKRNFIVEKIEMIKEKYADKLTSQGNDNWLCYQEVPFKSNYIFDSKEKILAILPSSRESLMLDIFSLLKNHASIVEKICDEINEDCRKSEG